MRRLILILFIALPSCTGKKPNGMFADFRPTLLETTNASNFDFLVGEWNVHNKLLNHRLAGDTTWFTFEAKLTVEKRSFGQVDKFTGIRSGKFLEGCTLRIYDPIANTWSLYWVDNWTNRLQPPLVGGFNRGVGEFFADDTFENKPVKVRFRWTDVTGDRALWDQSFSLDGGNSWEVNWIMSFVKAK